MPNSFQMTYREQSSVLLVNICGAGEEGPKDHLTDSVIRSGTGISTLSFAVENWNDSLSPWPADPVWGDEAFGGNAEKTLEELLRVISTVRKEYALREDIPVVIVGYSLAGLFALWSAYQTDIFTGVAAASPSVWFPDWIGYCSSHIIHTDYVYLSLGDREAKTRNRVMSTVQDCIVREYDELKSSPGIKNTVLEFNPGNHFRDPEERLAKAFRWNIQQIIKTNDT